jgi:hypothetical protein
MDSDPYLLLFAYDFYDWNECNKTHGDVAIQLSFFYDQAIRQVTLVDEWSNQNKLLVEIRCLLQAIFRRGLEANL